MRTLMSTACGLSIDGTNILRTEALPFNALPCDRRKQNRSLVIACNCSFVNTNKWYNTLSLSLLTLLLLRFSQALSHPSTQPAHRLYEGFHWNLRRFDRFLDGFERFEGDFQRLRDIVNGFHAECSPWQCVTADSLPNTSRRPVGPCGQGQR